MISPAYIHSILDRPTFTEHLPQAASEYILLHVFLRSKPLIFTEHLLWAGSVLGAGAAVALTEALEPCLQGAHGLVEEANRSPPPPGDGALRQDEDAPAEAPRSDGALELFQETAVFQPEPARAEG